MRFAPVPFALAALFLALPGAAEAQRGSFRGDAHPTRGSARIVAVDGQRFLELDASFRTDGGPDLKVVLHRQANPRSYGRGQYRSLGRLRRVAGSQRYRLPAGLDLSRFRSVVIWCEEFDVTFGHAVLNRASPP